MLQQNPNQLTPDQLQKLGEMLRNRENGDFNVAVQELLDERRQQQVDNQKTADDMQKIIEMMTAKGLIGRNVGGMNTLNQMGYNLTPQSQMALNQTMGPLPFQAQFAKILQEQAVANRYGSEQGKAADDQLVNQLSMYGPLLYKAKYTRDSLYSGMPHDPTLNRIRIILQRKRENSLYAFE